MSNDLRKFITIVEQDLLGEKYSADNSYLLHYMRDAEFDPYSLWYVVAEWIENNGYDDDLRPYFSDPDGDLSEEEPELFYKLPPNAQKKCAEYVTNYMLQHNPAEAPTWAHMALSNKKLLNRQTWLIHFSDAADSIAYQGFTKGIDDMRTLGLTTWYGEKAKQRKGYNFAFEATSRDARYAASKGKYGRHAVMFQNSGVRAYHHGDEEHQVMFWGADVAPRDIALLENRDGDWCVVPKGRVRGDRDCLYRGEFDDVVNWVIANFQAYHRALTGAAR